MNTPSPETPLKIGTRGSPLALAQAHETQDRLARAHGLPAEAFRIEVIRTTGDRVTDRPLKEIGGKGLFTKEIEEALLAGDIDIAVHSTKDMPTVTPEGLSLDAFLPREDPRDAFICLGAAARLTDLPRGAVVGTSSLRRRAQLLNRRPDLQVVEFRGNVQTRLRKLADGVAEATFLAMAGLNRLGADTVPHHPVALEDMLPAIAQGAICIERRADDAVTADLVTAIHDAATDRRITAERAFLAGLDGSCESPIAGLAEIAGGTLTLWGEILRPDGSEVVRGHREGTPGDGPAMGTDLAAELLGRGGSNFFRA